MLNHVDIWSRGEVSVYLQKLISDGIAKDCSHLVIKKGPFNEFFAKCNIDWASNDEAYNVDTDCTAYSAPSSYTWPRCPQDCPHCQMGHDASEKEQPEHTEDPNTEEYVSLTRITEISHLPSTKWDFQRLLKMCQELNTCYKHHCYLAVPSLVRAVTDHVPPIFGETAFSGVANNYKGARSFKEAMAKFETSLRPIADSYLHQQIRQKEALPNKTQVDFRAALDSLLQEIVRTQRQ